jgi:hypothetical protein
MRMTLVNSVSDAICQAWLVHYDPTRKDNGLGALSIGDKETDEIGELPRVIPDHA